MTTRALPHIRRPAGYRDCGGVRAPRPHRRHTIDEFSKGGERVEREALRAALAELTA